MSTADDALSKLDAVFNVLKGPSVSRTKDIRDYVSEIETAFRVCGEVTDPQNALMRLRGMLQMHAGEIANLLKLTSHDPLWDVAHRAVLLQITNVEHTLGGCYENARSLMANAQEWSIHFSNIRHAVTVFLAGLSWGVVVTNWNDYDPVLSWSAMTVWSLAVMLYGAFTQSTFDRMELEKKNMNVLRPKAQAKAGVVVKWGGANWISLAVAILVGWGMFVLPKPVGCLSQGCWFMFGLLVVGTACAVALNQSLKDPLASVSGKSEEDKKERGSIRRKGWIRLAPDFVVGFATVAFGFLLHLWPSNARPDAWRLSIATSAGSEFIGKASPDPICSKTEAMLTTAETAHQRASLLHAAKGQAGAEGACTECP